MKDHLGNVRMVLTEEQQQDRYPAVTLEDASYNGGTAVSIESQYYNIDNAKIVLASTVTGLPAYQNNNSVANNNLYSNTTANSAKLYKLDAASNTVQDKNRLGIVLKVMVGDVINIFGKSYHKMPGGGYTSPTNPLSVLDLMNLLAASSQVSGKGISGAQISGLPGFPANVTSLLNNQPPQSSNMPRASINWVILDEQFKYVSGGFDMVGTASGTNGTFKDHNSIPAIAIPKNGYIYVYCSNESQYPVFFDNLQIIHDRGAVLEETHYYPFGLTMAGISTKALVLGSPENKIGYNGNELQNKQFNDVSGLDWYDFNARTYDQQIGRFHQIDPLLEDDQEDFNPYHFSFNNPMRFSDADGKSPTDITIKGKNNSSITIKTDLIDISIDAGSILGDLGGNYTLNGDDILEAALDIVGILDPTGIADIASAKLQADKGDWGGAFLSGLGVIPYLGDIGKIGKIPKHVKTLNRAIDAVKAEKRAAKLSKIGREGKEFTKAGKEAVIDLNKVKNKGAVKCEGCGVKTVPAQQSKKGVKPSGKERQVDHKKPKSKGGSGTPDNGEVLCRDCNIKKSNN